VGLHLRCYLVSHCGFKRVVHMIQKCLHVIALRVGRPWPLGYFATISINK
jgi:hypothetical protein